MAEEISASLSARQKILAAAVELFAEHGPAGASMRELASRVGLHNSTLFHYFPDKQTLSASVIDAVAERQLEWLEPLATSDDPPQLDQLARCLDHWDEHLHATPAEARLLLDAMSDARAAGIEEQSPSARLGSILENWLERAAAAGAVNCPCPSVTARHLVAMTLFRPRIASTSWGFEHRAGELARLVIAALGPTGRQPTGNSDAA